MLEALAVVEAVTMEVAAEVVELVTDRAPSNAVRLVADEVEVAAVVEDTVVDPRTAVEEAVVAWAAAVDQVDTRGFKSFREECSIFHQEAAFD